MMWMLWSSLSFASDLEPELEDFVPAEAVGAGQELGLPVGAAVSDVTLLGQDGGEVKLLAGRGPVLVVFYKGGWCPYCNGQLRDLAMQHDRFEARGIEVVAVSADRPEAGLVTAQAWEIPFPVLSDPKAEAITSFGVGAKLNGLTRTMLKVAAGIDQPAWRGSKDGQTSLSGAFLVVDGVVRWRHVESALKVRPSAEQLLDALPSVDSRL